MLKAEVDSGIHGRRPPRRLRSLRSRKAAYTELARGVCPALPEGSCRPSCSPKAKRRHHQPTGSLKCLNPSTAICAICGWNLGGLAPWRETWPSSHGIPPRVESDAAHGPSTDRSGRGSEMVSRKAAKAPGEGGDGKYNLHLHYEFRNVHTHMQRLTQKAWKLAPPGGLFDETVLGNLFPEASPGARRLLLHRAVSAGEVIRLKRGLYLLAPEYRRSELHPFVLAARLHGPSHVSLESALSFHGLIPEAVFQVASVTPARRRAFHTPVGAFSFHRVPAKDPMAGVESVKLGEDAWAYIATPLRAIADMVYLNRSIRWERDGARYLIESLRMEPDDVAQLSFAPCAGICRSIRNRRVAGYLTELHKEVAHGRANV
jgi:hypothetical protein